MVKKFRKKPVVIEAIQYTGKNHSELRDFVGDNLALNGGDVLSISTLEGEMLVGKNDFIIKGIHREFYPCKPYIFEKSYEEVE